MDLFKHLKQVADAERVYSLELRGTGSLRKPDFEGVVFGSWKGLDPLGAGLVSYKGKTYKTKPVGFTSIPVDTKVQLSYFEGVYHSNW